MSKDFPKFLRIIEKSTLHLVSSKHYWVTQLDQQKNDSSIVIEKLDNSSRGAP